MKTAKILNPSAAAAINEMLSKIQAEQDTIYMKLASNLDKDPGIIYLTTYMLANIFSEKISSHNQNYQEMLRQIMMEDGLDAPQPLDDISEYIDFVNHQMKTKAQVIFIMQVRVIFYTISFLDFQDWEIPVSNFKQQ